MKSKPECITHSTILKVSGTNCPSSVSNEIFNLFEDFDINQESGFFNWDSESCGEDYPKTDKFLKSKNVTECVIRYW